MNIKKVKNFALAISIFAFAIGFSDLQENMFFWMGLPVGAVAFIVFFLFMLLEKEYAILDEQERLKFADLKKHRQPIPIVTASKASNKESYAPALTTATSH